MIPVVANVTLENDCLYNIGYIATYGHIRCIIKQQTKTSSKTGINNLRLTDACLLTLTLRQFDYSWSPREIEKKLI